MEEIYYRFREQNIISKDTPIVTAILACDPDGVIASNGIIPWNFKDERRYFLNMIQDADLIMGSKTYITLPDSIKNKHHNIVLSQSLELAKFNNEYNNEYNTTIIEDFKVLRKLLIPNKHYFMIGGAKIIHSAIDAKVLDNFLLTIVKQKFPGDTYLDLDFLIKQSIGNEKELLYTNDIFDIFLLKFNHIY